MVQVTVHDPRTWRLLVARGSVGLGEAYAHGWFDADDPTALLQIAAHRARASMETLDRVGQVWAAIIDPLRRRRSRGRHRDRSYVQLHYDVSNDLFELMLDETMAYSCALFEDDDDPLALAQRAKFDRLCAMVELQPQDHLLEIGTGWGGFAIHVATTLGCRVTTTTVSAAQYQYACKRVAEAGVADLVTVLAEDYRALRGRYEKIVSVEMIEAVDWRDHSTFFKTCSRLLRDGGSMALQAIVIEDGAFHRAKARDDFIKRLVFPGGCLPSVSSIGKCATVNGFEMAGLERIGVHYPETLRRWRSALEINGPRFAELVPDLTARRLWTFYLNYCEAAFLQRRVDVVQVLLSKGAALGGCGVQGADGEVLGPRPAGS